MNKTHLICSRARVALMAACGCSAIGLAFSLHAAVPVPRSYAVFDLGTLGGTRSEAYHIDNDGQVTGYSYAGGPATYGFVWQNGAMRKLGALPGGLNSAAYATGGGVSVGFAEGRVTNYTYWTNLSTGQIGTNTIVSNYFKACRWAGGAILPLEGLLPGGGGVARAVNSLGDRIAGKSGWVFTNQITSNDLVVVDRAVLWSSGTPQDLGPGPWSQSQAYDLNTLGDVVGTAVLDVHSNLPTHAVLFGSPYRDLHTLTNHVNSVALAINDLRQVVGYSFNAPTHVFDEPFFWSESTGMKRLTTPPGDPYGQALDINNDGVAVGFVGRTAAMWVNAGQTNETLVLLQDLLRPGDPFALRVATGINFWGEVTGYGSSHAFLLYPTNTRHRIDGSIQYIATGTDGLVVTSALAEASVEVFAVRGNELVSRAAGFADDAGRFSFLLPAFVDVQYALQFALTDRDQRVALFDQGMDSNRVAWLRTPPFGVTGDTRADVVMTINGNTGDANQNETAYQLNGALFAPVLAPPGTDGAPGPASNSGADRFAHAAVIFRNTRLAARFAVDTLGLDMPLIPVRAFTPGTWTGWGSIETNRGVPFQRGRYEPTAHFTPITPTIVFSDVGSAYNEPFVGISATNTTGARERYRRISDGAIRNGPIAGRNRPDNREFHEYGHYIMQVSSIAGEGRLPALIQEVDLNGNGLLDPEEDINHNGIVDGDENHAGLLNSNSSDAWAEGWAEFISAVISDTMLDRREKTNAAAYWVGGASVNLDDDLNLTNLVASGRLKAEEWVINSLLWDLYDGSTNEAETLQLPFDLYWQILTASGPTLETFHHVTDTLLGYSFDHPFVLAPTGMAQRILTAALFDDASVPATAGNGQYDAGEILGATSWIPLFPHRDGADLPERTHLELTATDGGGAILEDLFFDIAIEYEPPFEERNIRYPFFAPGPGPHGVPLLLPTHPARARITARKPGYAGGGELVVTSEEFWAAPPGAEPGSIDLFFLEHTFTLTAGGADLVLSLSATNLSVPVGGTLSMTFSVTNLGPSNATLVTLSNTLPLGVTLLSALPSQGACVLTNDAVRCDLGGLPAGASADVVFSVTPTQNGSFALGAKVSASEPDPAPENNSQTTLLTAIGAPALHIAIAPFGGPMTLSWRGDGTPWKLVYATSLNSPVLWLPVPFGTFTAPDGTTYATFPRPPFNAFFRLQYP